MSDCLYIYGSGSSAVLGCHWHLVFSENLMPILF